jgi:hypothetical protein
MDHPSLGTEVKRCAQIRKRLIIGEFGPGQVQKTCGMLQQMDQADRMGRLPGVGQGGIGHQSFQGRDA